MNTKKSSHKTWVRVVCLVFAAVMLVTVFGSTLYQIAYFAS